MEAIIVVHKWDTISNIRYIWLFVNFGWAVHCFTTLLRCNAYVLLRIRTGGTMTDKVPVLSG